MESNTIYYDLNELTNMRCKEILNDVYESLEERGYNPINQITGYLLSGDPGYISNHREARSKICSVERDEIINYLLSQELIKK